MLAALLQSLFPDLMSLPAASPPTGRESADGARVAAAGKFFDRGGRRFFLNGICYGPFAPNGREEPFPDEARLADDFARIRSLGFNAVRLYELPSDAVLAAAKASDLLIIAGIPWAEHVDFLSDKRLCRDIEGRVREAASRLGGEPAIAAFLVGNEIEKTLVRWMGPRRVRAFLERLIAIGRGAAPQSLFSYATYPSTEYLMPRTADFLAVNVYLERQAAWERYLLRLQNLAGGKPLLIAEHGLDAAARGEAAQAETMRLQQESLKKTGAAGGIWFSYTDEWHRGGEQVTGWSFGITDRDRRPREAAKMLQGAGSPVSKAESAPRSQPRISAIVCTRNGSATLGECLAALMRQRAADHEVLVVDDGSADVTAEIAKAFPSVRYFHQDHAGLSAARNRGMKEAAGEILAFTDDDCIPDEEWLMRIGQALDDPQWAAAGGANIPPRPRNRTEALVDSAPGGPVHVLLNDEEAEHLPGCNLCIRKAALEGIGGFHEDFRTAGDDVDVCWRLRAAGGRLRFVPGAFVWHHRRCSLGAFLRQQSGYGKAEALLMRHHPARFGPLGGARWRGAIYGEGLGLRDPDEGSVFHGPLGLAPFQAIYPQGIMPWWELLAGMVWVVLAIVLAACGMPLAAGLAAAAAAWAAWMRMRKHESGPTRLGIRGRSLLWLLCLLQPVVRECSRLAGMIRLGSRPSWHPSLPEIIVPRRPRKWTVPLSVVCFWNEQGRGRSQWAEAFRVLLREQTVPFREDEGWRWFDFELHPAWPVSLAVTTVTEHHGQGRCLTRIRANARIRRHLAVLLAAWLLGCLAEKLAFIALPRWLHGVMAALAVTVFLAAGWQWIAAGRLIRLAAHAAGLSLLPRRAATDSTTGSQG